MACWLLSVEVLCTLNDKYTFRAIIKIHFATRTDPQMLIITLKYVLIEGSF